MRILTVRQPWAWAIIHGGKDVENRGRNIAGDYRGPVAIHAGLSYDYTGRNAALSHAQVAAKDRGEVGPWLFDLGKIIGVVDLWAVHRDQDGGNCCPHRPSGGPGGSPWAERDVWHLCLTNARALRDPIPFKGALGLRRLDDETIARVLAAIA